MNCYFAPMEGITGYIYRNAHHRYYGNITQYFTPFIAPNRSRKLTSREINDILPEHNQGIPVVPQLLTNRAEDFLWAAEKIQQFGYKEVNLNLGCPSGTVVTKYRGAGFLALPRELDQFLETVSNEMRQMGMKFSIKTRIGKNSPDEFEELLSIFNQYPLEKLIIHPRIQTDFYRSHPNLQVFRHAVNHSRNPVCYNGDIFSEEDGKIIIRQFPEAKTLMLGRGLLQNPSLAEKISEIDNPLKENSNTEDNSRKEITAQQELRRLRNFHDTILEGYRNVIPGDRNVLFKMKELWSYWGNRFVDKERLLKKIKKARLMEEYLDAVDRLFLHPFR